MVRLSHPIMVRVVAALLALAACDAFRLPAAPLGQARPSQSARPKHALQMKGGDDALGDLTAGFKQMFQVGFTEAEFADADSPEPSSADTDPKAAAPPAQKKQTPPAEVEVRSASADAVLASTLAEKLQQVDAAEAKAEDAEAAFAADPTNMPLKAEATRAAFEARVAREASNVEELRLANRSPAAAYVPRQLSKPKPPPPPPPPAASSGLMKCAKTSVCFIR